MTLFKVVALFFASVFLPIVVIGQDQSDISVTELAEGLYQIQTDAGAWTTNMVAFIQDDGLLLVDSGEKEFLEGIKKELELLYPGNPTYILNTHAHVDHTGGNAAFGAEPVIIAHDIVRDRLRSGRYVIEEYPDEALPDITFNDSLTLYFNGETIRIIAVPGSHSDNDVIVHFTRSGVACLGDLAYGMHWPSVDGLSGDVLQYGDAVGRALDFLPDDVKIVSGHGRACTIDEMRKFRDVIIETTNLVREQLEARKSADEIKQENVLSAWAEYGEGYVSADYWIDMLTKRLQGVKTRKTIFEPLYFALKAGGFDSLTACYHDLRKNYPDDYLFHPTRLYLFAVRVLHEKGMNDEAINLLKLNIDEFPESNFNWANYDALGQAYLESGDTTKSIENYNISLQLNPDNTNAVEILEQLNTE